MAGRIRRPGAGRKPITKSDPQLVDRLEAMIDEQTRGDPESPLRWTCQSTRAIADALTRRKHPVSHTKVAQILHRLGYSLQGNRKTEEGEDHPDRDTQFRHINNAVKQYLKRGWPVISVDTKKKELIDNYLDRAERSRFGHIVAGVYSPRSPKFSRTRTLGASVRVVSGCGHSFGVADASGFVLVGDPARIHLVV
jgi:hypothetical protein